MSIHRKQGKGRGKSENRKDIESVTRREFRRKKGKGKEGGKNWEIYRLSLLVNASGGSVMFSRVYMG